MRTTTIALLVSSLVLSCTNEPAPDWFGDARFTESERANIEEGARWLYTQAGLPPPRIEWGYELEGHGRVARTIRRESGPAATGQCVGGVGGTVFLDAEKSTPEVLPGWVAHELAHCVLGFEDRYHLGEPSSEGIMRILAPMRWTESEREQCRANRERCLTGTGDP